MEGTEDLASRPAALGSVLGIPKIFKEKSMLQIFNNSTLLREWTVKGLMVDRTHIVLVSVKLVLQEVEMDFFDEPIKPR